MEAIFETNPYFCRVCLESSGRGKFSFLISKGDGFGRTSEFAVS